MALLREACPCDLDTRLASMQWLEVANRLRATATRRAFRAIAGAGNRSGGKSGHYCLTRERPAVRLSIVITSEGASQIDRSR